MKAQNDNDPSVSGDFIEFLNSPLKYKYSKSLYDSIYISIGRRSTLGRVVGIVLANGLAVIFGLLFIYRQTPYWPPVYKDLQDVQFQLAFLLLSLTSFLAYTTVHFLIFRAVSGKGKLLAQGYLNAIGSTWTLISIVFALLILVITRVETIDIWVVSLVNIYLGLATFFSLRAVHQISTFRAIIALIVSIVATAPGLILYNFLFEFLRQSRPFSLDDPRLIVFFLSAFMVDLNILAYMFYEQKQRQLYPETGNARSVFGITVKNEFVKYTSITLAIPLIVLSGLDLYRMTRPDPIMIDNPLLFCWNMT